MVMENQTNIQTGCCQHYQWLSTVVLQLFALKKLIPAQSILPKNNYIVYKDINMMKPRLLNFFIACMLQMSRHV